MPLFRAISQGPPMGNFAIPLLKEGCPKGGVVQLQKRGKAIHCLSAASESLDGRRAEQLFTRNFPYAVDFFGYFLRQGKKYCLASEVNKMIDFLFEPK